MWILVEFQTGDIGCFYQMSSYTFMICHCILSLLIGTFQEICWWHWLLLLQLQLSFGLKWSVSCLIYFYHCSFLSMQKKKEKNNKSHSCPWSVSRVDGSLHSLCSSCGKFKVIFFANSVFFCLLTHAPDLLHGRPRAYICLGCVGGCSCGLLPEK